MSVRSNGIRSAEHIRGSRGCAVSETVYSGRAWRCVCLRTLRRCNEAAPKPQRCIKPSPNSPLRSAVERIEIADDLSSNGFVGAHDQREFALG